MRVHNIFTPVSNLATMRPRLLDFTPPFEQQVVDVVLPMHSGEDRGSRGVAGEDCLYEGAKLRSGQVSVQAGAQAVGHLRQRRRQNALHRLEPTPLLTLPAVRREVLEQIL
eukprot:scaffold1249_cov243-Pinguiococcus_pyrenoidosus.AAC.7